MVRDLIEFEPSGKFKGSMAEAVKSYPDIEYLDNFVINSGDLGPVVDDSLIGVAHTGEEVRRKAIDPPKPFHELFIGLVEALVVDLQTIAKLGAIANGDTPIDDLVKVQLNCEVPVKAFDSGLYVMSDFNKIPTQSPCIDDYFTEAEIKSLRAACKEVGQDIDTQYIHASIQRKTYFFLYPPETTDLDAAANMFMSFMNNLFEGDATNLYSGNVFKVERREGGFAVVDNPGPLREMFRECACLVANHAIRLCAHCGKPLLADKSRGNEAMYCSRSCNTKASIARRDTAYAMAAAGAPVEEAIEKIGQRYETSIRRWYKESHELLE